MARDKLLGKSGVFQKSISTGGNGLPKLLQKAHSCLTYSSLCLPEDIAARGVEDIPCYYYRQDGMKLWKTIKWFVEEMIKYYYPSDRDVIKDTELQDWAKEIFSNGFLNRKESGIPESFRTVHELIKFLTMVLYTCSVQHNAVNGGQFDFAAWMPNASPTLRRPPPSFVGGTTQQDILESIADVGSTVRTLAAVWLLSRNSDDFHKQYKMHCKESLGDIVLLQLPHRAKPPDTHASVSDTLSLEVKSAQCPLALVYNTCNMLNQRSVPHRRGPAAHCKLASQYRKCHVTSVRVVF
ncbi:Arachidonate 15-lipoxygenase B [Acipenser ruthenus]|uniref:Arachidonate 15-lipoxygenase B n=1 Tax=Acipenser ruthenus TaxID=7906 RepID=A0A444USI1_ACIRT|nr:Arachidonate 15-lipoxygenase B [Acipenser ruthenus]